MKIGRHYFIEFSETGNACYGYEEDGLPIDPEFPEFTLEALKVERVSVFREVHRDGRYLWENKFEEKLAEFGIHPDGPRPTQLRRPQSRRSRRSDESSFDEERFRAYVADNSLIVSDNRMAGGYLWVRHLNETGRIADRLRGFGFTFSRNRGFFR
jgi:hypothetical protein